MHVGATRAHYRHVVGCRVARQTRDALPRDFSAALTSGTQLLKGLSYATARHFFGHLLGFAA